MSRRVLTAACLMLAGAVVASEAVAAPALSTTPALRLAPGKGVLLDRTGYVVNLNLGGVTLPPIAQDGNSLRVSPVAISRGIEMGFVQARNWDSIGNLFPSNASLTSAYLSGTNTYAGASFALGGGVSFTAGYAALGLGALAADQPSALSRDLAARLGADMRSIGTTTANLSWNFADWGGVGLSASRTTGNASLLGVIPSSLALSTNGAESQSLGISARVGFGEGWVTTVAYSEGVTQLDLNRALKLNNDALRTQAYGIGFAKEGVFGSDALGIAVSRPLQVFTGAAVIDNQALASGMGNMAHESDVSLGYVTTFLDGTLALQANAAYQVNAAGVAGQNAATGVVRARLNF